MSYLIKRPRLVARRRRHALGDDTSDAWAALCSGQIAAPMFGGASIDQICKQHFPAGPPEPPCAANPQADQWVAKAADLDANWQPSGYYSADQLDQVISATMAMNVATRNAVDQARADGSAIQDVLAQAQNDLDDIGSRAIDFLKARDNAKTQNIRVIDAPGLKRWVIDAMTTQAKAMRTISLSACTRPWWLSGLQAFQSAFDKVWSAVKALVEIVVKAGETVLEIPDTLASMWTALKWGVVLGGAYLLYKEIAKRGVRAA